MTAQASLRAIEASLQGKASFCKFLSANDSGETGGHQVGFLISMTAKEMLFPGENLPEHHTLKKIVRIQWQNDFYTDSCFTWYRSKNELRLTRFGRNFPLSGPEYTGALLVLVKKSDKEYEGYVLSTEADMQQYLDTFGITPAETNRIVEINQVKQESKERIAIQAFLHDLKTAFPSSAEMSRAAREIEFTCGTARSMVVSNPDQILLKWIEQEYRLFRAIEKSRYGDQITTGFRSVDDFIVLANQVLNRRKSRAGKSLENHLAAIFDGNQIQYTAQGITEGNKRPDFIFPSEEAYHDPLFSIEKLCTLAAKTTCKDRWRQVINEADRLRDENKYLCTLQQGISAMQMDEMQAEHVILVVPRTYIAAYPKDRQERIWTIGKFVQYVKQLEEN